MQKIGITTRHNLKESQKYLHKIFSFLEKEKKEIFLSQVAQENYNGEKKYPLIEDISSLDLLVILGGDGTTLNKIQDFTGEDFSTPLFGINGGTLGFLTSSSLKDFENTLNDIFEGKFSCDERGLLYGEINRENGQKEYFHALNECVIHHSGIARIREICVDVSHHHLTTYHADGLIVATPTGSTAYNLSAGGPIVSPRTNTFVLTPIAPSGFSQRSIVVPSDKSIHISLPLSAKEMILSIDGQKFIEISARDTITLQKHEKKVTFLRLLGENYPKTIREKLGWGQ